MKKLVALFHWLFFLSYYCIAQNVGIGTTSPQKPLSVGSAAVIDQNNTNTGSFATGTLSFGGLSGEGIGSKRNAGTGQWGLDFYTNGLNRMTVANNGNVGINVINPSSKLELRGPLGFSSTNKKWEMNYDSTNQYFYIDEFGANRRLFIKNGGNVGIGNANPQTTLDVNGDVNIQNRLFLNNSSGSDKQVLVSNGNAAPSWQNVAYSNNDRFYYMSSWSNYVNLTDTIGFETAYNHSGAITYNNKVFTVNKSGLYHFQGNLIFDAITTADNIIPYAQTKFHFSFTLWNYPVMFDPFLYRGNNGWLISKPYEFTIFLQQGSTFHQKTQLATSSGNSGFQFKGMLHSPLTITLISE